MFGANRALMGEWRVRGAPLATAWLAAAAIVLLNVALLWQSAAA